MSSRSHKLVELARKIVQSRQIINDKNFEEKLDENLNPNENYLVATTSSAFPNYSNISKPYTPDELKAVSDFDSDDSIADPNFTILDHLDSFHSSQNDDELLLMGQQIENNLLNLSPRKSQDNDLESCQSKKYDSQIQRQIKRNVGLPYKNKKGILRGRKLTPLANSCRKNCKNIISPEEQKQNFDNYWKLGSYNQRLLFISSLMNIEDTKTRITLKHLKKPRKRPYHIKYNIITQSGNVSVCQKCFKQCFGETYSFLKSVSKKKIECPNVELKDSRGGKGMNKTSEEIVEKVKAHICEFPAYESHYTRRDSSCKYFHSDLTITKMYNLFLEKYSENIKLISLSTYTKIFKTMNIKFKKPKLDTCCTCDMFKAKIEAAKHSTLPSIDSLKMELQKHNEIADFGYESKRKEKMSSVLNKSIRTYTFDLEQCLPTPFLRTSISFYKRFHDCYSDNAYCYVWHEGIAKRGGNEISCCLLKHLKTIDSLGQINQIIFYSDSCVGQNKNSFVSTMFLTFLQFSKNIEIIDHKFLEPGHTHMESDCDHALIERKKKQSTVKIYHPRDWSNLLQL